MEKQQSTLEKIINKALEDMQEDLDMGSNCDCNYYEGAKQMSEHIKEYLRGYALPTDGEIEKYTWEWVENGEGSGDKYFADCNFRSGAKWMRDTYASKQGIDPLKFVEWTFKNHYTPKFHDFMTGGMRVIWHHGPESFTTQEVFEKYQKGLI